MPNTLFIRLEGPFQSWGERARWSVRDSAPEPTKSGLVGLLGCALGLQSDASLRELCDSIRVGVRCDRPGEPLVDYHTVFGGVLSAEGKVKKTASTGEPETVVSWRTYLCDASFLVAIQAEPQLIAQLAAALKRPHWPIYLGRKACVPALPVFENTADFSDLVAALSSYPLSPGLPSGRYRAVVESEPEKMSAQRRDRVNSNHKRTFLPRYTCEMWVQPPVCREVV